MVEAEQSMLFAADLRQCMSLHDIAPERVMTTFRTALEAAGATVVGTLSHAFSGEGLTCVLILAESHAVLHTWPETGTVNIDIFSCSTRLNSLMAIRELGRLFEAGDVSVQEIPRADGHASSANRRY
jgi:S-adenosylmethionine decarboxylase